MKVLSTAKFHAVYEDTYQIRNKYTYIYFGGGGGGL